MSKHKGEIMQITVHPISKKGKQLVKSFGSVWVVKRGKDFVQFSDKRGPWLLISPERFDIERNWRWINRFDDDDLKIVAVNGVA